MATIEAHTPDRTATMLDRLSVVLEYDPATAPVFRVEPNQQSRWRRGQKPGAGDRRVRL